MDDASETAGEFIGVYRLRGELGRGGMGEVFLAHDDRLDRPVAIKRIRRRRETSEVDRERFRREARAAAKLNHPAITQVYDVVLDETGDSIVMEYVPGRTVATLLAEGDLDAQSASDVAVQVARGLAEAHSNGFVHRDLKAENVMVTPAGQAKILDFGLAKPVAADETQPTLTESGAVVGTFSTLSPEQAAGGTVDARSDLFSFGVLLYEMFTGRSPFRRQNRILSLQSVLADRPPPPRALRPELPAALSDLIEELLAKDPERRPASAAEVESRLRESSSDLVGLGAPPAAGAEQATVLSDAATRSEAAAPVLPVTPAASERRSKRWPLMAAVAVLAVLATLFVVRAVFDPGETQPLRVRVLEPRIQNEPSELVGFGVLQAALGTMASLEGVNPLAPSAESGFEPTEADWEAPPDEELKTEIVCDPTTCLASFQRLGDGGEILDAIGNQYLPIRPEDGLVRAQVVRTALLRVYRERRPRASAPQRQPEPEDYQAYLEIKLRADSGKALGNPEAGQLEALIRRSPELIEAYLLAAEVARSLEDLERARRLVTQAARIDSEDPRLLFVRARLEIESGRLEAAAEAVDELERAAPGDLRAWKSRAELHFARNDHRQAIDAYREIVARWPTWRNTVRLTDYEMTDRRTTADARRRLEELLEANPDYDAARIRLAVLATLSGQLKKAEELYEELYERLPEGSLGYFAIHNLGWVHFLVGDQSEAEDSYRQALELAPGDPVVRFNLALVRDAGGHRTEARALFEELLAALVTDDTETARPCPDEAQCRMILAQCLARTGRLEDAKELTEDVLQRHPKDAQALYQAAQVYVLAGEPSSARHYVRRALEKLLDPVWFEIPSFDPLRSDPEFQELLADYVNRRALPEGS